MNDILEILKYTVPSLITAGVATYFLRQFIALDSNKRKLEIFKEKKQQGLPLRLQAYERMTLFLERTSLNSVANNVQPGNTNKIEYAQLLIMQINSEFEHNLVQQIYISNDCWDLVKNTKQTILNNITACSMNENITSGKELQEALIKLSKDGESPTNTAQQYVRKEVQNLF